jgi:hypothetical protein
MDDDSCDRCTVVDATDALVRSDAIGISRQWQQHSEQNSTTAQREAEKHRAFSRQSENRGLNSNASASATECE